MFTHPSHQIAFQRLQKIRIVIGSALSFFIADTFELGSSPWFLAFAAALGVFIGGRLARRRWSFQALVLLLAGTIVLGILTLKASVVLASFVDVGPQADFLVARVSDHLTLFFAFCALTLLSTWSFWRFSKTAFAETVASSLILLWLMSGHENYQLDAPQRVSMLAFKIGIEPQYLFLAIGAVFVSIATLYLLLSSARPLFRTQSTIVEAASPRRFATAVVSAGVLILFSVYLFTVNQYYSEQLSRASNGVGQKNEQGESPLGFHSAVGKTKQPAALVRLEGDYTENPWAPMMYLREGALSEYNGKELVGAASEYDTDAPRLAPGQSFSLPVPESENRKKVVQSVYLLSKHRTPFAIDFPQSIRTIRNPDPQRFLLAYQALSYAPTVKAADLIGEEVGDPSWSKATWDHYLRAPGSTDVADEQAKIQPSGDTPVSLDQPIPDSRGEDLRYAALSQTLAVDKTTPVEKALAVASYLSESSIYTRSPGHQVTPTGDPVSPYLFAKEKRGYCVHFAHASVYLLRLMGIPARIATGYLTDLKFAKDGHILLQMGDRHAWPEIYVRGIGWTVFDINPAKAENEQELVPDENLLDELMQKLDPAEQFVTPPPIEEPARTPQEKIFDALANKRTAGMILLLICLTFFGIKLYLRFGWRLSGAPRTRALRAYTSFASLATDVGVPRSTGETRREYSTRVLERLALDSHALTAIQESIVYRGLPPEDLHTASAILRLRTSNKLPWWKRIGAFLNPTSIFKIGRW